MTSQLREEDKGSYLVAWLYCATDDDSGVVVYDRVVGTIGFVLFGFWYASYHKIKRWLE